MIQLKQFHTNTTGCDQTDCCWQYRIKKSATHEWENTWFGISTKQAEIAIERGWAKISGENHRVVSVVSENSKQGELF